MISSADNSPRDHFRFEWIGNGFAIERRIRVVTD